MSYVGFGDDSHVYVIGTIKDGRRLIECCGCLLIPRDAEGMFTAPFPQFASPAGALAHLGEHQAAGQMVPGRAVRRIAADGWLTEDDGSPVTIVQEARNA